MFVLVHDSGMYYKYPGSVPLTSEIGHAANFADRDRAVILCGALNDYRASGDQFSVRGVHECEVSHA